MKRFFALGCLLYAVSSFALPKPQGFDQLRLSPVEVFERCYAQMTRRQVPQAHPLRARVIDFQNNPSQGLSDIDACMTLLEAANLDSSADGIPPRLAKAGENTGSPLPSNLPTQLVTTAEILAVLKTFHDFHRSFFPSDNFRATNPHFESFPYIGDFYDPAEPAAHYSRVLFDPRAKVEQILIGYRTMKVVRDHPGGRNTTLGTQEWSGRRAVPALLRHFMNSTTPSLIGMADFSFPDYGAPRGFRMMSPSELNRRIGMDHFDWRHWGSTNAERLMLEVPWNRSFGGGAAGSKSFYWMSFDQWNNVSASIRIPNPGLKVPRRWARDVLQNFLCRELPVMHPADAAQATAQNQTLYAGANAITNTFRAESSCYKCHGTIDGMAGGMRHITLAQVSDTRASAHLIENPIVPECSGTSSLTNANCRMVHQSTPVTGQLQNCAAGDNLCLYNNARIRLSRQSHPNGFHPVFYGTLPGLTPGFDWSFAQRPPDMEFTMRDMHGNWVSGAPKRLLQHQDIQGSITGFDERGLQEAPLFDTSAEKMGRLLAGTDDFLACTASRYYSFFTGVSIPVFDSTNPDSPQLDDEGEFLRQQLLSFVSSMKLDQQSGRNVVRELLRSIWSSEAYRSRSLRVFDEGASP